MAGGQVNITINDGGSATIIVPGSSVQLVLACSSIGTVNQIIATRTPATLTTNLGVGPLVEAAALSCLAGGTVLAMKVPSNTAGALNLATYGGGAITVTSGANPDVITTTSAHGLLTGQVVTIAGVATDTAANGTWNITKITTTTFSIPKQGTAAGTGGTVTVQAGFMGSTASSPGTGAMWVTGTPNDTYFVKVLVVAGFTTGTAGGQVQISLDAGRNYGPVLAVGTGSTLAITGTGLTINFQTLGVFAAGDFMTAGTTEPYWNTAGIQSALNAFQASQYALQGVGSIHIAGMPAYAGATGATCSTIQGYLDTLASGYVYTRAIMSSRDVSPPVSYGGTAETEAAWQAALLTDYSATSARRMVATASYWNMPTGFPQPGSVGAPRFRRPLSYALAARQVTIPQQRHAGRVKDGNLAQIVVDAVNDPTDGFVYHDERINPGLDYIIAGSGGRFTCAMTRIGLAGVYISNPLSMAPLGSDFYLLPLGLVMDVFASIMRTSSQTIIDDDVRVNANGTIFENDARAIESFLASQVNSGMFAQKMISQPVGAGPSATATGSMILVDRTTNVKALNLISITGQIIARGYVLTINETLGFQNPNAAV